MEARVECGLTEAVWKIVGSDVGPVSLEKSLFTVT